MLSFLSILQLFLCLAIIGLTLVQGKGGGLSGAMGGSINSYGSRRGVEKLVVYATIASIIALVVNSVLLVLLK